MSFSPYRRGLLLCGSIAFCAIGLYASKQYEAPKVSNASTYAAHDSHPEEHVTIAADPYNTSQKASIFRLKYLDKGVLPIYLVITNENGSPITLSKMSVQLVSRERHAKLSPMGDDDIFRRMTHAKRSDDVARTTIPLPFPTKHKVGGMKKEDQDEVENAMFQARAVEPRSTKAGFVFFDVSDLNDPLAGATLYVTGVRDNSGNEFMYFEIPLDKAR